MKKYNNYRLSSIANALAIVCVSLVQSQGIKYPEGLYSKNYAKIAMREEPLQISTKLVSTGHSPSARYNSRESSFIATKVDSSLNGYGAYNSDPNPLAFVPDVGYVAVYRQFQGFDVTAGYIGAAQSEDGEEWFTEQKLNECYPGGQLCEPSLPTATGTPQGRYPSAGFTEDGQPTAIWNEYTNSDYGGGTYGGFPLYAYDSDEIGESSTWSTPFSLNNGCATTPCDPPDLWTGNARVINGPSGAKLVAQYNSWTDDTKEYMITSSFYTNGYFLMNDPYISFDQLEDDPENPGTSLWYPGGYQSTPDWSINEDGVGYMAVMGRWNGANDDNAQSLYIKKTEDYGETWTNDGGFHNSGWYEWSDELQVDIMDSLLTAWADPSHPLYDEVHHYGDTIAVVDDIAYIPTPAWLPFYEFDIATDDDGGVHVVFSTLVYGCKDANGGCDDSDGDMFADSLYYYYDVPGVGMMYMYNPDPTDDYYNWSATHLSDMSNTYAADFFNSPIPHQNTDGSSDWWGNMQYFYPQLSTGPNGTLWFASSAVSDVDTSTNIPLDIDIFLRKSVDNGLTWSEEENITDTPYEFSNYYLETGMHLAQRGTEDEIGVFFQMADFENETYPPATGYEDYLTRVYVGVYGNDFSGPLNTLSLGISESGGLPGDTITLSVWVELPDDFTMYSHLTSVAGFGGDLITFLSVDTFGTITPPDWLFGYNAGDSGGVVISGGAGSESVSGSGNLFNLSFVLSSDATVGDFANLFLMDVLLNEDEDVSYTTYSGGVLTLGYGDVSMNGSVTAFDASLILQSLVGSIELDNSQANLGDVTQDASLSALDAAVILDYVVGLVGSLPVDESFAIVAGGDVGIPGGSVTPGDVFMMPIELEFGSNVRSFELEFSYDPEVLVYQSISWSDPVSGMTILDYQEDGLIKVSAAGQETIESGSTTLGWVEFELLDTFEEHQTTVTMSRSRLNEENILIDGSVAVYTNALLVVDEWGHGGVPDVFALKQNFPNPFNPLTQIRYQLPEESVVTIQIYDIMGRAVRSLVSGQKEFTGYHQVTWDATNNSGDPVSAGMYLYVIQAGEFRETRKMVLMK